MNALPRLALLGLLPCLLAAQAVFSAVAPELLIQRVAPDEIQLSWASAASGFVVEQADTLTSPIPWQAIPEAPLLDDAGYHLLLSTDSSTRFFRLRQGTLTTVASSSPVNGETGVAVTRETIIEFSQALSSEVVLTTNHFYATFGGRRLLSRIELSSDRRKATLFYLEPLPGSARVTVLFDSQGLKDAQGQPLDPSGSGMPGGVKVIQFDTLSLLPLPSTAVIGRVFASEPTPGPTATNSPLAGVTITVDGQEQTMRAVTDAQGRFALTNCPAGRFFVHIDGRTVRDDSAGIRYPDRSYYPFVGKAWDAVAGRADNPAGGTGEIFLPLIRVGTLQAVSATEDTVVGFPAEIVQQNPLLAGVTLTVPANALFSDSGTRGGKVGIAPVAPDRLPGPLPAGLEMPLVITVQTDGGLNFDRPAPICFPNLPDPTLKVPLPPGSKQALMSFNHDKGIWEPVGSMTVSADGKMICSDPGSGILQPGWHGTFPPPLLPPPPSSPPSPPAPLPPCPSGSGSPCDQACSNRNDRNRNRASMHFIVAMRAVAQSVPQCTFDGEVIPCANSSVGMAQAGAAGDLLQQKKRHPGQTDICLKECVTPCAPSVPASSTTASVQTAGLSVDPVSERIVELMVEILRLMEPFIASASIMPPEVQASIQRLFRQADSLAGGDSVAYLQARIIADEEAQAAYARSLGVEPENLEPFSEPDYSIPYLATVNRPSGPFSIRGETGPRGQYSLFIPRDGSLARVEFYDPKTHSYASIEPYLSPQAPYPLPRFLLSPLSAEEADVDHDGLPNVVEQIYGTDLTKADSDGDGILDGAEIDQATNPLDGLPVRTGIVGTARTLGTAIDVAADQDRLAVAQAGAGVSIFSTGNGMNLVLAGHFPAVGNAQRVAVDGPFVAVASPDLGVLIVDATSSPASAAIRAVKRPGAQAITAAAGVAYAGFDSGSIVSLDLETGRSLQELSVTNAVLDLALYGDHLFALAANTLFTISLAEGRLTLVGSMSFSTQNTPTKRLFVGGGVAYTVHLNGYNTIDVTDPAHPVLLTTGKTAQFGWKHLVANGSGLGIAAVAATSVTDAEVSLYDLRDPRTNDVFLTQIPTPGVASAVTIFKGFAYVADSQAGIQIVNYLPFDTQRDPPSVSLNTSAVQGQTEASGPLRLSVNATDDVQVRQVEFHVDGERAFTDGSFPFEHRLKAPARTASKTNLIVRARAIDTGGNSAWSDPITLTLSPDISAPRVLATTPLGGSKQVTQLFVAFSEPMAPASLNTGSFRVVSAGADGVTNTADDEPITGGVVSYGADLKSVTLEFATGLPQGFYRAVLTQAATDAVGNHLAEDYGWQFRVADAVFWNSNESGDWGDASNWSTGVIPGPNDDVILENLPASVGVELSAGATQVRNLKVGAPLAISRGSTLQVTETIELHAPLTVNNGTIKGGAIIQTSDARLLFAPNAVNILDGLRIVGDLVLTNGSARATVRNGLELEGKAILENTGRLIFSGNQTFNTGQILFAGSPGILSLEPGTTLTLGPDMVVRGKSGIVSASAFGTVKLINQGLIALDVSGGILNMNLNLFENHGTLAVGSGGSLNFLGDASLNKGTIQLHPGSTFTWDGSWTNQGTVTANESTLNLGGTFTLARLGTVVRTGGTLNLNGTLELGGETLALNAATGPWRIERGTLRGGTVIQSAEARLLFAPNAANTLDAMRVVGDLVLTNGSARATIRNGLELEGKAILENTGGLTFSGNQTFNTGQILFPGTFGILSLEPGTTLTLGPDMVVRGKSGIISASAFGIVKLINQGLLATDTPGGTLSLVVNQFENIGTIRADGAGTAIRITANPFTNTGQTEELNGGQILINP